MSHELRTPLNAVIGYPRCSTKPWRIATPSRKMRDLDRIQHRRPPPSGAGQRRDRPVLDRSQPRGAQPRRSTLSNLVNDVIATAEPLAAKRDNRLIVNMPEKSAAELDPLKVASRC